MLTIAEFKSETKRKYLKALANIKRRGYFPATRYLFNLLISVDQFFNVLLAPIWNLLYRGCLSGPFGDPDETISSCVQRIKIASGGEFPRSLKFYRELYRFLERLDPNHTEDAFEMDEGREALDGSDKSMTPHFPFCGKTEGRAEDCNTCQSIMGLLKKEKNLVEIIREDKEIKDV